MRKVILFLVLIVPIAVMAQKNNYTIIGNIANLNSPAKAYLIQFSAKGLSMDSAAFENGRFEIKGIINDPKEVFIAISRHDPTLMSHPKELLTFYLEPGIINLNSLDSLQNAVITGSKINSDNSRLQIKMKQVLLKEAAIWAELKALPEEKKKDKETISDIDKKKALVLEERFAVNVDFIKSNPDSYLSLILLKAYISKYPVYAKIEPLFSGLSDEVKQTEGGVAVTKFLELINSREYAAMLENAKGTAIGVTAKEFTQNDPDGKPIKLSDFKGKYVLVDFWASWCGPCRAENPNVLKAYSKYHDKGLEILGVSLDTDKTAWLKAISDDKLIWKQVSDLKGWKNEVGVLYGIKAVPSNYLIDPTGRVIAMDIRGEFLNKKLAELMK